MWDEKEIARLLTILSWQAEDQSRIANALERIASALEVHES